MILRRLILLLSLILSLVNFLSAQEITLDFIKKMPWSLYRDFYIDRLYKNPVTDNDAKELFFLRKNVSWNDVYKYSKQSGDKDFQRVIECRKMGMIALLKEDKECFEAGISIYKLKQLAQTKNKKYIKLAYKKLDKNFNFSKSIFNIFNSKDIYQDWLNSRANIFFTIFAMGSQKEKEEFFNKELSKELINRVAKSYKMNNFINQVVFNPKLVDLQKSLLKLEPKNIFTLKTKSIFLLSINSIKYGQLKNVEKYLQVAYQKAYYQFDKDKMMFWLYPITNNQKYLKILSSSWDINIYTLLAIEKLNLSYPKIIDKMDIKEQKSSLNLKDPFIWVDVLNNIKYMKDKRLQSYQNKFAYKDTQSYLAYINERASKFRSHYFITPYEDILKDISPKRKALIYALGRQESRFIPVALSRSYAMGVMQIMPFLSRALAKELKDKDFELDDMFDAKKNLKYADHHLDFLEKRLKHPLFISYGYNGGIGFTRRKVLKNLFLKNSKYKKYEPYISMELVPYSESRKYGKKVLANYVIYANKFGLKVTATQLLESLK